MSKAVQINIAEPCHENWQQMTPNEQGRFCGACQKNVVDFTAMTDKEILEFIAGAGHNICGRVNSDQMNRDIKVLENKRRFSFAYVWNLVLATFLLTKADAQTGLIATKKPRVTKVPETPRMLGEIAMIKLDDFVPPVQARGVVVNAADGTPVHGASVFIKDKQTGVSTDSAGKFDLSIKLEGSIALVVSSIGFETQTVIVDKATNWQNLKIALAPAAATLDDVEVIAYPTKGKMTITNMGAMRTVRVDTLYKVKTMIREWLPKKNAINVFPNPTPRGELVNVSLAVKQAGQYRMEILDASGKIVHAQLLQMPETARTVQVPTQSTWSAGVYWLRISGKNSKNVYQSKVIIQ